MMRSLWTAASGMRTQQMYVDSISNNIANVNTSGFKKERMEFRSLFYETLTPATLNEDGIGTPVGIQMGHGVRAAANYKDFSQGSLDINNNPLDFSIEGDGFFVVRDVDGEMLYTKQGSFKVALVNNGLRLVTSDGYAVMTDDNQTIDFDGNFLAANLSVDSLGTLVYLESDETVTDLGYKVGLAQFKNPAGLDSIGGTYYKPTAASGDPEFEDNGASMSPSKLTQGAVESSNVQIVDEMVKMIVAQRAYELNSRSIQTSDDMLRLVNQLKR